MEAVWLSGVRHYICGMANGCDMYFGEAVLALREQHTEITLEAAVPYQGQAERWEESLRARYRRLLDGCDFTTVVAAAYSAECMRRRNHYMVDSSSVLIACYDGRPGGTVSTMLYAMRQGLEIIEIQV